MRVPERDVHSPAFEDPELEGRLPEEEALHPEDCAASPEDPRCLAGTGAYVCNSCPGASDANPGTPSEPLATISEGIRRAQLGGLATVYVANASVSLANTYREQVVMAQGVSVRGRFVPGAAWTRSSAVRTVIENPTAEGLLFPPGITRSTTLDGFLVLSAGGAQGATLATAILIRESSPTLSDTFAGGLAPGAPAPSKSVGVRVEGSPTREAMPRMIGPSTSEPGGATGDRALELAVGVYATNGHVDLQRLDITGGEASRGVARGVWLNDSTGSRIRESLVSGGNGASCFGLEAEGAVDGVVVEASWISGCELSGSAAPDRSAGVLFHSCSAPLPGLEPRVVGNLAISAGNALSTATGVAALDGCPLRVEGNPNISAGEAPTATGLLCSHRSWSGAAGRDSACVIVGNTVLGGLGASVQDSVGIACSGSCASQGRDCAGSCAELSENQVNASAGLRLTHVLVEHSSPLVRSNRIGLGAAGLACLHHTSVVGLALVGASARVENNFVLAGPCEDARGLVQTNVLRASDGSWAEPDVHSNSIVGGGSSANTTGSSSYGVVLRTLGDVPAPPLGLYRNNILVGGQNNHRVAFLELDAFSDPGALKGNAFVNFTRSTGPKPLAYIDEGSKTLLTAGDVNGLPQSNVEANVDDDPMFLNTFFDFHLQPLSPLRARGVLEEAPAVDLDGDPRPSARSSRPDIGADEVP